MKQKMLKSINLDVLEPVTESELAVLEGGRGIGDKIIAVIRDILDGDGGGSNNCDCTNRC